MGGTDFVKFSLHTEIGGPQGRLPCMVRVSRVRRPVFYLPGGPSRGFPSVLPLDLPRPEEVVTSHRRRGGTSLAFCRVARKVPSETAFLSWSCRGASPAFCRVARKVPSETVFLSWSCRETKVEDVDFQRIFLDSSTDRMYTMSLFWVGVKNKKKEKICVPE